LPVFLLGASFSSKYFSKKYGFPIFSWEQLLVVIFPVKIFPQESYFQHLYPGELKGNYFLARIPTGSFFL
jgi:hypothetical protein